MLDEAEARSYNVLIVSDHGFNLKSYDHSDYGYWSIRVAPDTWRVRSVLDFHRNILAMYGL